MNGLKESSAIPLRNSPLSGLLVLDLSRVLAGPLATMILADLGARVIKVEDPRGGDPTRSWSPPSFDGESAYFLAVNRRKESVAVDLSTPVGAELVRRFAAKADVVVENFLPGTLEKWGLGVETLCESNPRLVVCSISGYGERGPMAGDPGYDLLAQGVSGLMSITGPVGAEPSKSGMPIADILTGWAAATAILSALAARARDGVGAHVKTDLFSATLSGLVPVAQGCLLTGREAPRRGNAHPSIEPYRPFQAKGGGFLLAVGSDRQFETLAGEVLGRPELASDPRFLTNEARVTNREALVDTLGELFSVESREYWLSRCRSAGIPAGPIWGVREALTSEHAVASETILVTERPRHAPVPTVRPPFRLPDFEAPSPQAPPRLDEDGARLFAEVDLPRPVS